MTKPDYKKIYTDIIARNCPEKRKEYENILLKKRLNFLDVIELNKRIFRSKDMSSIAFNQQHRAYNKDTIAYILEFQKKNNLNNSQLASHFKLSRNTITKWKKIIKDMD